MDKGHAQPLVWNENDAMVRHERKASREASIWSMQGLMTFLLEGNVSAGRFTVIEYRVQQGDEPPPHIHTHEDEFFYVLDGHLVVFVGKEKFFLGPGGHAFLPKGKPHAFCIASPTARLLVMVAPAGLEGFFRALGEPATTLDIPPKGAMAPQAEVTGLAEIYGLGFLSADEITEKLPSFLAR
jgi:quercetin dioxygenase-like cupin family protein